MNHINRPDLVGQYNFSAAKIKSRATLSKYGMDDRWYGGNAGWVAELEGDEVALVISKRNEAIGVLQLISESKPEPKPEKKPVKEVVDLPPATVFYHNPEEESKLDMENLSRKELLQLARQYIGGKVAQLSNANIKAQVKEKLGGE